MQLRKIIANRTTHDTVAVYVTADFDEADAEAIVEANLHEFDWEHLSMDYDVEYETMSPKHNKIYDSEDVDPDYIIGTD